jgi:hypothetical protein
LYSYFKQVFNLKKKKEERGETEKGKKKEKKKRGEAGGLATAKKREERSNKCTKWKKALSDSLCSNFNLGSPQKERTVFTRHLSFHFSRLLTAPIYLLVIMLHSRTNCVTDYVVRTRILYINLSC